MRLRSILVGLLLSIPLLLGGCRERKVRWHYGPLSDPAASSSTDSHPSGVDAPSHVERMLGEYGCTACHSFHGERLIGPSLSGLEGRERRFVDGTVLVVSRDYLMESLFHPDERIVDGYTNVMPSYEGVIDDATAEQIAAYLLALR